MAASKPAALFSWILLCIIAGGAFLRLYQLSSVPFGLHYDEAMNGNLAREALETGRFKVFYQENNGNEGLYINCMAIFVKLFGSTRFAVRLTSAIFGILTIWGIGLLGRELFSPLIGLFAAFFIATSFWHLVCSRIGTHAIAAPCFLVWAIYLLSTAMRRFQSRQSYRGILLLAGIVYGAGFHTYLAYRVTPLLIAGLWYYFYRSRAGARPAEFLRASALFAGSAALAIAPLAIHFALEPAAMSERAAQVSVFQLSDPMQAIVSNAVKTAAMFFGQGDDNWRHNYNRRPEVFLPVAVLFLAGMLIALLFSRGRDRMPYFLALSWLVAGAIPAILSAKEVPHVFRSILMIPPVFLLAAAGAAFIYRLLCAASRTLAVALSVPLLLIQAYQPFHTYFHLWAPHPEVAKSFAASITRHAFDMQEIPRQTAKYVVSDADFMNHNIPLRAQPVAFLTESYTESERGRNHVAYIHPRNIELPPVTRISGPEFCAHVQTKVAGGVLICLMDGALTR